MSGCLEVVNVLGYTKLRLLTVGTNDYISLHTWSVREQHRWLLFAHSCDSLSKDDLNSARNCMLVEDLPSIYALDVPIPAPSISMTKSTWPSCWAFDA